MKLGLGDLPDDIVLLVLDELETAGDIAHVALCCRRLHRLMNDEGWRIFARSRFSSLSLPSNTKYGWDKVVESLTWQSRCWDRRSLSFKISMPQNLPRRQKMGHFHAEVDAHIDLDSGQELVAWGAGEDIILRSRPVASSSQGLAERWLRFDGKENTYRPGFDDVRALKIVKNPQGQNGEMGILAGRDSGDISLLRSIRGDKFGVVTRFRPPKDNEMMQEGTTEHQSKFYSLDVSDRDQMVAAATPSHIHLYHLPQEQIHEVEPAASFDLRGYVTDECRKTQYATRWMGDGDHLAVAFGSKKDPLRYLTAQPHGFVSTVAAKNSQLEERFGLKASYICPTSIQPVGKLSSPGGGGNLLLSAWDDGTVRLQDIRTPSPWDLVYQDNIDPWPKFGSLLPFGTERFVAGGMTGVTLKIFDFRWPRKYYHTAALPCSDETPFPSPRQPFAQQPRETTMGRQSCEHLLALRCAWHDLSRNLYYRPNCNFYLSSHLPVSVKGAGVWSLAKAADMSPNFYVGIAGGMVEASLQPSNGVNGDPNFEFRDVPDNTASTANYSIERLGFSMMETGDGLASVDNHRTIQLPPMLDSYSTVLDMPATMRQKHRLDEGFQQIRDFKGGDEDSLRSFHHGLFS